jgi:hypothetical protein
MQAIANRFNYRGKREPMMPDDSPLDNQVVVDRVRFGLRKILPPDLMRSFQLRLVEPSEFERYFEGMALEVRATVYKRDLPPERVSQSTVVELSGVETAVFTAPDGPWMRWRERHQTARWYRALLGWLSPIRHLHHTQRVPWSASREVTCQVDLSRFVIYPESHLGEIPGLGPVVIEKHRMDASWLIK